MTDAHLTDPDEPNGAQTIAEDVDIPVSSATLSDDDAVYADADHWMHSLSADDIDVAESGAKIDLTDINLSAIVEEPTLPDKGTAHSMGRKLNIALCALAFVVLFGYLFIAGEGEQTLNAFTSFNYAFLLLALIGIIIYWVLESASMQLICNELFAGFSFVKTNIVTVIGQYFNCITPLSSGGQPMQAYYYSRFGLPVEHAMPMLLCRFIVYQLTMTVYAVIVLILRFNYFTQDLRPIMYLVAIGFFGGFVLIAMLFSLAFAKGAIIKTTRWVIKLLGRIGILKQPDETLANATQSLEESYAGIRFLLKRPKVLIKVSLVTFVQLTVYFSLSWVIFAGFGLEANDYFTVVSCQAFVYLIASFVPLPGAIGASEASYITFFNYVYGDASIVALSTFIWRFFTFYLPIVLGMALTLMVNNENSALAHWLRRDDIRMAFTDHTVVPKEKKHKKKKDADDDTEAEQPEATESVDAEQPVDAEEQIPADQAVDIQEPETAVEQAVVS
ncbi:MAG: flippase-like domain-containing protein [Eggerthellaceae bacterium]|nr:flippase-like domain-containing protein [Eggerthellaceae bacterium]